METTLENSLNKDLSLDKLYTMFLELDKAVKEIVADSFTILNSEDFKPKIFR